MTVLDYSEDQRAAEARLTQWILPLFESVRGPRESTDEVERMIVAAFGRSGSATTCSLSQPLMKLGGYAGTGKTTLIGALAKQWIARGLRIAFATFTGKASTVLAASLARAGVVPAYCGTIHRLIYQPDIDESGRMRGFIRVNDLDDFDLLVIDEASMLPTAILQDLQTYGLPILAVGDHGQLPPVGEDAGVMSKPDIRLERIHRQALGNPIITIASAVRQGVPMKKIIEAIDTVKDERVRHLRGSSGLAEALRFTNDPKKSFLITYTNAARTSLNAAVRRSRGIDPASPLQAGESVICLRNNYEFEGVMIANGMRGIVETAPEVKDRHWLKARVAFDNGSTVDPHMLAAQFGRPTFSQYADIKEAGGPVVRRWDDVHMLADFGYCLTCHKSQGSQADNVAIYLENSLSRMDDDERKRWLYTAITRASSHLLLVSP